MRYSKSIPFTIFTIATLLSSDVRGQSESAASSGPKPVKELTVQHTSVEEGDEQSWAMESSYRNERIYPSNWGQAGIFRVRSAESFPKGSLTFGIGAEFYSVNDAPDFGYGSRAANSIAESIFVGYTPIKSLTLSAMRRSSSTTFGNPQVLTSSLGDFNLSASYSFPLSPSWEVAPFVDFLIASNFNAIVPAGTTLSAGVGGALSYSLFPSVGVPLIAHFNAKYHAPQIRSATQPGLQPESFFDFSRFHTITLGLGAEYRLGDFIPFVELNDSVQAASSLSFLDSPSKISVGTRFTPLDNKSVAILLGADIGLSKKIVPGVPFSPDYQILGQLSYTVGVSQTERKHYFTTTDVNVVDRKFIIKKAIDFKLASAELMSSSTHLLDQIATVIKENKVKRLLVIGHTDSTATENYNLKLSLDRANSVKRYLVGQGVPEDTLFTQGYGKRKPRASNLTEEGRALNRRVEFFILE